MYETKNAGGRGYTIAFPVFSGDGTTVVNHFYETLSLSAAEYFESIIAADKHAVCRLSFTVHEEEDGFTVKTVAILRRSGRKCGERTLIHRWKRWRGKEAALLKNAEKKRTKISGLFSRLSSRADKRENA